MACLFKANSKELNSGYYHIYDIRTAYLVFFVIGTVVSIAILVLGVLKKIPHKLAVIIQLKIIIL